MNRLISGPLVSLRTVGSCAVAYFTCQGSLSGKSKPAGPGEACAGNSGPAKRVRISERGS